MNIQYSRDEPLILSGRGVTAVLGPTNTGKTHLAIERMVAHSSGLIGLPLRLLAREVYSRVCEKVGEANVALVTGEEKIIPEKARFSVCTVEAMPRQTDAAFVAIDEVQLAGDLERGHIFTDRLLHLRGREETLLLGAATMRPILERLLSGVSVVTRPRMSHLAYSGSKKITRLPRRSAIVAFSADEVYAIAELIRRQRGGAAVVLGALSPRTRNAQVELFQSGDVGYLIATDAIGMGLNLDVDHVAFAQNRKFDGFQNRDLTPAELAQIAGRAGRHVRDGTFGVTGQVNDFDQETVRRIESHEFPPVKVLQWRTAAFDFSSLDALRKSVETPAPVEGLTRALPAVDIQALDYLSRDDDIKKAASNPKTVELLWDVCALPDYRRIAPAQHADIISSLYMDLVSHGHIDENYMADQIRRADRTDGDLDTLSHRIAQIRTWTYVSHRPDWLADPTHWQEKTRDIEDRLSDALHERLTKRFVDRRTSVLMKRLREDSMPEAEINSTGEVLVEGHHIGDLAGFRFTADASAAGEDAKAVRAAAQKVLAREFETRAEKFAAAPNSDFALGSDNLLRWLGAPVAALSPADDMLNPRVILLADEQLTGPLRDKVQNRAERFVAHHIETLLKPLQDMRDAEHLSGVAKGVAFRLYEENGLLDRRDVAEDVRAIDAETRRTMRRLGARFGFYHIYIPALLKPAPAGLLTQLWALKNDGADKPGYGDVLAAMAAGRTSMVTDASFDMVFYKLAGFRHLGARAVRVDILERLADLIRPALAWNGNGARPEGAFEGRRFVVTPGMLSILGATAEDMEQVLKALGYRCEPMDASEVTAKLEAVDRAFAEEEAAKLQSEQVKSEAATKEAPQNQEAASAEEQKVPDDRTDAPDQDGDTSIQKIASEDKTPGLDDSSAVAQAQAADAVAEGAAADPEAVSEASEVGTEDEGPKTVLVWRMGGPRASGDRRPPQGRRGKRPQGNKDPRKGGKVVKSGGPNKKQSRPSREPDPDSPFAKLAALKDKLGK